MLSDTTLDELHTLSPQQRAAFAAGAALRLLNLYFDTADQIDSQVQKAIDKAWEFAAGSSVDPIEYHALFDGLEKEAELYGEVEDQNIRMPWGSIMSAIHTLKVAMTGEARDALSAANYASREAERADSYVDQTGGEDEETSWQIQWLKRLASIEPQVARNEWSVLTPDHQDWYKRWEQR